MSSITESWLPTVTRSLFALTLAFLFTSGFCLHAIAQTDEFGDAAADPVRLFERGQGAHARGELTKALDYYEQAIKVRPEFPEAEFQRGNVLVSLGRLDEAEGAFRRAIALKKEWALPYSALGALLMRKDQDTAAADVLQQSLRLDPQDNLSLRLLSEIRLKAGDPKGALELATRATRNPNAPTSAWVGLAIAEKANGDSVGAKKILDRVLGDEPNNLAALVERADLFTDEKSYDLAIGDLKAATKLRPEDKSILSKLVFVYQQAGLSDEAAEVAKSAGLKIKSATNDQSGVVGTPEEIEAANSDDQGVARRALEKLIEKNPKSAVLLARLGASYRTDDPPRSLELYRRAAELQPANAEYAVGYAAALVQTRRFADAAVILRRAIRNNPDNYAAHANLATALYELKQYADAILEFEWILQKRPEVSVATYFIATAHDYLGEYPEALASYQKFLSSADAKTNQLEIDKVKLRLPTLQRQIQLGEGAKKKP